MDSGNNEDLMARFKAGDDRAFDEIVAAYKTRLFRYLTRFLGDPSEAEDALQDLFVKVFNARYAYNPSGRLDSFLYRIASNICKDRFRRKRPRPGLDAEKVPSPGPTPVEELDRKVLLEELDREIARLPENQRQVLLLVIMEEKSYEEVVQITGFSLSAVKSLLFRARTALKKNLGPRLP